MDSFLVPSVCTTITTQVANCVSGERSCEVVDACLCGYPPSVRPVAKSVAIEQAVFTVGCNATIPLRVLPAFCPNVGHNLAACLLCGDCHGVTSLKE